MSSQPNASLTFDQIKAGDRFAMGNYEVTYDDVIAFASKYDPQPYHLDEAAAAANPLFDRLSASGWHTAIIINLLLDRFWKSTSTRGLAGAGVDQIRWIQPVYPGDTLTGTLEIVAARPSASKPGRGVMSMRISLQNQHGEPVATMAITGMFAR